MKRHRFGYKTRSGMQSRNGNGGSSYSSSCTFYTLFVDGKEEKEFDREWEMIRYINQTYYPKKWATALNRVKKLREQAKEKEALAQKLEQLMTKAVY